jgi:outer membrane receptor for ferrienterochelin and colicins
VLASLVLTLSLAQVADGGDVEAPDAGLEPQQLVDGGAAPVDLDAGLAAEPLASTPEVPDAGAEPTAADERLTTVVTATRSLSRLSDSPVPTEVITRKQILETGARDLTEALQARAGVELFPSLGGTTIRMQGLGPEYNLVVVDGQRAVGRVNGQLDISRYSVEDIEQLEVVKGPSSVLWGADALAGVVHLVTRQPQRPFGASGLVSYGLLNQLDARASAELSSGKWGVRGSYAYGQRDAFDLDPATVQTSGSSFRNSQGSVRGTYGSMTGEGVFADLRAAGLWRIQRGVDANTTGAVFDRGANDILGEGSAHVALPLGPGRLSVTAGLNLWWRRFMLDQRNSSALDQLQDSTDRNVQAMTMYEVTLFERHKALAGIEALGEEFASPRILGGTRRRGRVSAFVQDTWAPFGTTRLMVVPGLRVDLDSLFGPVVTPRLAARFDPHQTVALRAAVGTGFRAPSFQELYLDFENTGAGYVINGNAALGPERSVGLTFSADWQPHPRLAFAGSLFWNELSNMIAYDSRTSDMGLFFTYANIERARTRGGEVSATVSPAPWLSWGVGATLTDARNLSTDQPLDNQALFRAVSQLRLRFRSIGVNGFVRASVTSGRPLSDGEASTRYTAPFVLVDARVSKTFFERLELFVVANNLVGAGNASDLLLTPRQVYGGLSFTW